MEVRETAAPITDDDPTLDMRPVPSPAGEARRREEPAGSVALMRRWPGSSGWEVESIRTWGDTPVPAVAAFLGHLPSPGAYAAIMAAFRPHRDGDLAVFSCTDGVERAAFVLTTDMPYADAIRTIEAAIEDEWRGWLS